MPPTLCLKIFLAGPRVQPTQLRMGILTSFNLLMISTVLPIRGKSSNEGTEGSIRFPLSSTVQSTEQSRYAPNNLVLSLILPIIRDAPMSSVVAALVVDLARVRKSRSRCLHRLETTALHIFANHLIDPHATLTRLRQDAIGSPNHLPENSAWPP